MGMTVESMRLPAAMESKKREDGERLRAYEVGEGGWGSSSRVQGPTEWIDV